MASSALNYLHDIGQIVKFEDFICLDPPKIPVVMSRFISPKEVRMKLMESESTKVEILSEEAIRIILSENQTNPSLLEEELSIMCKLKVCYQLLSKTNDNSKIYLFPSLAEKGTLRPLSSAVTYIRV